MQLDQISHMDFEQCCYFLVEVDCLVLHQLCDLIHRTIAFLVFLYQSDDHGLHGRDDALDLHEDQVPNDEEVH